MSPSCLGKSLDVRRVPRQASSVDLSGIQAALPDHQVRPIEMSDVHALVDLVARGRRPLRSASPRSPRLRCATISSARTSTSPRTPSSRWRRTGRRPRTARRYDDHSGAASIDVYMDPALRGRAVRRACRRRGRGCCRTDLGVGGFAPPPVGQGDRESLRRRDADAGGLRARGHHPGDGLLADAVVVRPRPRCRRLQSFPLASR